jgi:hypothetical protein
LQQFALASVYPRSIAWLIRLNEWDRLKEIIKYNCAMVGGYFNVIVPLNDQDSIAEEYQKFLVDYDPDLVVLAPEMATTQLDFLLSRLHPFSIIQWDLVSGIALLDLWSGKSGANVTLGSYTVDKKEITRRKSIVASADEKQPDTSRLALVACGDLETQESIVNNEEHPFPLSDAVQILKMCCELQRFRHRSLISSTASYKLRFGSPQRPHYLKSNGPPALIILISDNFSLEEAALFWNLRANEVYVAWLSFSDLENNSDEIINWLDADNGGIFYWMYTCSDIAFSSSSKNSGRLQVIFDNLKIKRHQDQPSSWCVVPYEEVIFYDYVQPYIKQERVVIGKDGSKYSFVPRLPQAPTVGEYTVTLEWNGLMLPHNSTLIYEKISPETITGFMPAQTNKEISRQPVVMPRFRFTRERYLKVQISTETPIEFNRPSSEQIIETLFITTGFSHIEPSSAAKYHISFINRANNLEKVADYLAHSPYRELLEVLSNNSNKNLPGWILSNPSKRRVLHHLHLREVLGKPTPSETKKYFNTVSDELPDEAGSLLEKGLLERGFELRCSSCSYKSWYPAQHVSQTFECARCFQTQVYDSNPLWLYKLPEVIFQGFEDNMHVPLLTLSYLKRMSKHYFEWVPDSNVYWFENNTEVHNNVDILCLGDGKFYVGEAKSNNEIDSAQFSFYEDICRRVTIDGIVFATSKPYWGRGTSQRIERLKTQFDGEVIVLTEKDLYQSR